MTQYEKPLVFRSYEEFEEYLRSKADYTTECDDCTNCTVRTECEDSEYREEPEE